MPADPDSRARLLAENARLAALLDAHGIEWRIADEATPQDARDPATGHAVIRTDEEIAMFRRLFGGRADIYPVRWETKATSGAKIRDANPPEGGFFLVR